VIAVARHGERLRSKLGDVVLQVGDTLLVETDAGFLRRHGTGSEFLMASEIDGAAHSISRGR
jgi:hypothetical protein